jgi:hypothetical protein
MRLAGTWKQYSAKAISQLTIITVNKGALAYLRCPYQAKVMKMLDIRSRTTVFIISSTHRGLILLRALTVSLWNCSGQTGVVCS